MSKSFNSSMSNKSTSVILWELKMTTTSKYRNPISLTYESRGNRRVPAPGRSHIRTSLALSALKIPCPGVKLYMLGDIVVSVHPTGAEPLSPGLTCRKELINEDLQLSQKYLGVL
eukprot:gnl/MRDRNA2_/MRDRNA2_23170_c0_seq1.p1 gnl/MRDRNA2_/MRDRNA2_23170_c0~~gnl/MRDRNA2_/MRDRNA2_23170_c0_seq1.p1  ORF type:complete len:115 (-),score=1.52 gnl/MRDRNA2_/MRDRNA2_23170_c0_seq1:29-373(-)